MVGKCLPGHSLADSVKQECVQVLTPDDSCEPHISLVTCTDPYDILGLTAGIPRRARITVLRTWI